VTPSKQKKISFLGTSTKQLVSAPKVVKHELEASLITEDANDAWSNEHAIYSGVKTSPVEFLSWIIPILSLGRLPLFPRPHSSK